MPSFCGMLVYKDLTSMVANMQSFGMFKFSIWLIVSSVKEEVGQIGHNLF